MRGHIAIITKTESTYMYVMIESTLQYDDVEVIPGLLPLLQAVQRSRTLCNQENRVGDSLGTRLQSSYSNHSV